MKLYEFELEYFTCHRFYDSLSRLFEADYDNGATVYKDARELANQLDIRILDGDTIKRYQQKSARK